MNIALQCCVQAPKYPLWKSSFQQWGQHKGSLAPKNWQSSLDEGLHWTFHPCNLCCSDCPDPACPKNIQALEGDCSVFLSTKHSPALWYSGNMAKSTCSDLQFPLHPQHTSQTNRGRTVFSPMKSKWMLPLENHGKESKEHFRMVSPLQWRFCFKGGWPVHTCKASLFVLCNI